METKSSRSNPGATFTIQNATYIKSDFYFKFLKTINRNTIKQAINMWCLAHVTHSKGQVKYEIDPNLTKDGCDLDQPIFIDNPINLADLSNLISKEKVTNQIKFDRAKFQ